MRPEDTPRRIHHSEVPASNPNFQKNGVNSWIVGKRIICQSRKDTKFVAASYFTNGDNICDVVRETAYFIEELESKIQKN